MREFIVILLSSVKFGMTFPVAIIRYDFSIAETIIWTNLGGILGIVVFAFLSEQLIIFWNEKLGPALKKSLKIRNGPPRKKKKFSPRNRRIVRIKSGYGLPGIALATPVLFSIPLGVFLAVRYFSRNRYKLFYIFGGNIVWSFIYSYFYSYCRHLLYR